MTDVEKPANWAEQVDRDLPAPVIEFDKETNQKKITEYKYNDKGEKVRVVKYYKLQRIRVPKEVAERKMWKKFGASHNDPAGPNSSTTIVGEEVQMQFLVGKDANAGDDDDPMKKLKDRGGSVMRCRHCQGDHLTAKCPFSEVARSVFLEVTKGGLGPGSAPSGQPPAAGTGPTGVPGSGEAYSDKVRSTGGAAPPGGTGKYVPPQQRGKQLDGGSTSATPYGYGRGAGNEESKIRVSNLPEDTTEDDLRELFSKFGRIQYVSLARHRPSNRPKGFAYITFSTPYEAERAIRGVSRHGYDHLILNVELATAYQRP